MNITTWPADERPREKLLHHGVAGLSDAELLAILLRTGVRGKTAVDLARQMLAQFGGLRNLLEQQQDVLCEINGLGEAKCAVLQAALELSRRYLQSSVIRIEYINDTAAAQRYLCAQLRSCKQEVFAMLFLDNRHYVIKYEELFHGSINSATVYPREVVRKVIQHNAAAVILAHNHTSGVAVPSAADKAITLRLQQALQLIDVKILDHVVVGEVECFSFLEKKLL